MVNFGASSFSQRLASFNKLTSSSILVSSPELKSNYTKLSISTFDALWMGFVLSFFWLHFILESMIKLKAWTRHTSFAMLRNQRN
jgi:hypothetical protein